MSSRHKEIAVLYHGGCPDGFGGAYAAWKKFGDLAEYIPVKHGWPAPENLDKKTLYFIDFCYSQEIMKTLVEKAASVTVLDHHMSKKEVTESMPNFVFDNNHSGAIIAWKYFHPSTDVPLLLKYVEDGDLYTFILPNSRAILAYVYAQRFKFEEWDDIAEKMEIETELENFVSLGKIYAEHFAILVEQMSKRAVIVLFEGYESYLVGSAGMFASDIGNHLAHIKPPIGIVVEVFGNTLNVSLRSDSSVNVSEIAKKYGGGGHARAAGFNLPWGAPLPWKMLSGHEDPRH